MASVVTEPCIGCKDTSCVTACPVDCFHEGETMLVIDPHECTCCQACLPVCPVGTIFDESAVPDQWRHYVVLNAEGAKKYPQITEKKAG